MEWNGDKPIFVCASTGPCCEGLGFEAAFESWLPKMLALLRYAVHIQPPAQADLQKGKPWQQWREPTRLAHDESSGDAMVPPIATSWRLQYTTHMGFLSCSLSHARQAVSSHKYFQRTCLRKIEGDSLLRHNKQALDLVGGFKHFWFSKIYGIILHNPSQLTNSYFSEG